MSNVEVKAFYDKSTSTISYVVYSASTKDAVIIDPVLDYEPASSKISTESVEQIIKFIRELQLRPVFCLETHAHADHLSGAQELKKTFTSMQIGIGDRIIEVQDVFKKIYNLPEEFIPNGSQFDFLLKDGEMLNVGSFDVKVIATPGHTPACSSYLIGENLFTGDALFMPDTGTGRCDFPKGSSQDLYQSIQKLYSLPDSTKVYVGHDYQAGGTRDPMWISSIGEQKKKNIQIREGIEQLHYVRERDKRDATLSAPRLLLPSIQVNIDGGRLPEPESNGTSYLKIPIRKK